MSIIEILVDQQDIKELDRQFLLPDPYYEITNQVLYLIPHNLDKLEFIINNCTLDNSFINKVITMLCFRNCMNFLYIHREKLDIYNRLLSGDISRQDISTNPQLLKLFMHIINETNPQYNFNNNLILHWFELPFKQSSKDILNIVEQYFYYNFNPNVIIKMDPRYLIIHKTTPLMYAVLYHNKKLLKLLLKNNADPFLVCPYHKISPYEYCIVNNLERYKQMMDDYMPLIKEPMY